MTSKDCEDALTVLIRTRVERFAGGRIHDLEVAHDGGRIVLKGRSRTQYAN